MINPGEYQQDVAEMQEEQKDDRQMLVRFGWEFTSYALGRAVERAMWIGRLRKLTLSRSAYEAREADNYSGEYSQALLHAIGIMAGTR